MTRTFVAVLLVALAVQAEAAPEAFRCEARGGRPWREYRTAHFLVDTDLSESDASQLVQRLEELHALELQAMLGEVVEIPGRLRVIAFRDPRQYRDLAGPDLEAFYSSALGEPAIVLYADGLQVKPENTRLGDRGAPQPLSLPAPARVVQLRPGALPRDAGGPPQARAGEGRDAPGAR